MKKIILVILICILAFVSGAMISANILWTVFGDDIEGNFKNNAPPYKITSGELYVSTIPLDSLDGELKYALHNISEEYPNSVNYDTYGNIHINNKSVFENISMMLKKDDKELDWVLVPNIKESQNSSRPMIYKVYSYYDLKNLNLTRQQLEKILEIYGHISLSDDEIKQLNLTTQQEACLNNTLKKMINNHPEDLTVIKVQ
ncbi:hypothetical protein [Methanococcus voltae]|uniref:Uncharacterized protein n=1 Tax=Methanococcus voltae (strain ATCC BAA-1334 / A3) TaxID=456320 RepID=D7DQW1_METV3|nr:hypothetical protein [Methanococcus voltae]MCS3900898.1 hypothetical protein [Methanococcus voltae]